MNSGIDNKEIFCYIIIGISIMVIISWYDIKLNIVFGFLIAYLVINTLRKDKLNNISNNNEKNNIKKNVIMDNNIIKPNSHIHEYDDMLNFLFSINDLYHYNPPAFIEMVDNIERIFKVYKRIIVEPNMSGKLYPIIDDYRRNSLNALQSIIFKVEADKRIVMRLDEAIDKLDAILTEYQKEVHYIYLNDLHENGYNVETHIINTGPKEYNLHHDEEIIEIHQDMNNKFSYHIF